jgi:hypothetical protein
MVQQYDFVRRVREELEVLEKELSEPGVSDGVRATAERIGVPTETALAAFFRAAKRSGYSLRLMLEEINRQLDTAPSRQ